MELCVQNKLQVETSLQQMQDLNSKLQEDLQITTRNYEAQLRIMSDHLADMNDKLTVQRDEIDQLKYQLSNKVSTLYPSSEKCSFSSCLSSWAGCFIAMLCYVIKHLPYLQLVAILCCSHINVGLVKQLFCS